MVSKLASTVRVYGEDLGRCTVSSKANIEADSKTPSPYLTSLCMTTLETYSTHCYSQGYGPPSQHQEAVMGKGRRGAVQQCPRAPHFSRSDYISKDPYFACSLTVLVARIGS